MESPSTVRGVPFTAVAAGRRIPWTLRDRREMAAHCARHRLTLRNYTVTGLEGLVNRLGLARGIEFEAVVVPKLKNALLHLLKRLGGTGALHHWVAPGTFESRTEWPAWTQAWVRADWDGEMQPPVAWRRPEWWGTGQPPPREYQQGRENEPIEEMGPGELGGDAGDSAGGSHGDGSARGQGGPQSPVDGGLQVPRDAGGTNMAQRRSAPYESQQDAPQEPRLQAQVHGQPSERRASIDTVRPSDSASNIRSHFVERRPSLRRGAFQSEPLPSPRRVFDLPPTPTHEPKRPGRRARTDSNRSSGERPRSSGDQLEPADDTDEEQGTSKGDSVPAIVSLQADLSVLRGLTTEATNVVLAAHLARLERGRLEPRMSYLQQTISSDLDRAVTYVATLHEHKAVASRLDALVVRAGRKIAALRADAQVVEDRLRDAAEKLGMGRGPGTDLTLGLGRGPLWSSGDADDGMVGVATCLFGGLDSVRRRG